MAGQHVVVVGGGGTGDAAAFALRKRGFDGQITVLSADTDRPYDRPYLSKEFLRGEIEEAKVYLHDAGEYAQQRIELRTEQRVVGGSLPERKLELSGGGQVAFDILVLGLGGTPRRLPGVPEGENVLTLRSLRDAKTLRTAVEASHRILTIGAGFIGAEVSASARRLGKEVLLVEAAEVPLERALGREVGQIYAGIHRDNGVDLRTGTTVREWHQNGGRVTGVTLSDGSREDVDLALLAVGISPNLELPTALGLASEGGGVRVDQALRAADNVYAGGDIAVHQHPLFGRGIRIEHWEVAKGHGRGIAASIAGGDTPYTKVPYFWSDQYDVSLEYRGNASGDDVAVWRGDRESRSFSVFYLRSGLVAAVLSMNDGKTNELGGKLIESRRPVERKDLESLETDLSLVAAERTT
ncbi:MAG TPA: FAD-dependent oxidoreductase [Candidatus Dormibacteraeota bacterium]|nr:FAD-dependent oxidoreductase [Candidatus Dormibacteraeota bacterium]